LLVLLLHSHIILKTDHALYYAIHLFQTYQGGVTRYPKKKLGETITQYKDTVVSHFKDMEVDVKDWNFAVGKTEEEYTVEVKVKLGIKPKKK
jgi:hypothetical protein